MYLLPPQKRGNIQNEFKFALEVLDGFLESDIFIIHVRLENCEIPYEKLMDTQYVDMFPDWDDGLELILQSLGILPQPDLAETLSVNPIKIREDLKIYEDKVQPVTADSQMGYILEH